MKTGNRSFAVCFFAMQLFCGVLQAQTINKMPDEQYRPQVHFSPKKNWINDPNGMVYHNGIYHNIYVFIHSNHTIYSNTFLQFLCIICYKNKNDTLFLMHTSRIKRHFYYRLYLSCLLIFIPGILIFKCIYNRIYSTNYNKPSSWHS